MNKTVIKRSPWCFFLLVFIISIPGYVIGLVPPYSILMVIYPLLAALLLTCREAGRNGVERLLGRSFDYRRIKRKIWYVPIFFLMPGVLILEYGWMVLIGGPIAGLSVPVLMMPVYFLVFFLAGIGEEIGWSGYALDSLQVRWGALPAGILIGTIWALWHIVPYILANPPVWVAGQCASTVLLRVIMVWIYNNTGKSLFGMILFHAMINMVTVPDFGFRYNPVHASAIFAVLAAVVTFLWGPKTLACFLCT